MLIRRRDDELVLFRQVDHGTLAGEFVDLWGNDSFAPPTPLDGVRLAATIHDEGWRAYDAEPLYNEAEKRALSFAEIDQSLHIPLYQRGVDEVFDQDLYAGLLVSMHWTGLYRARWGLQPIPIHWATAGRTPIQDLQDEAIAAQEHRWVEVKQKLLNGSVRTDFEINLWQNFDLMQAFDLFSIFVCMNVHEPASSDAQPELLGFTLRSLDQVPGPRIIPNVPFAAGRERVDIVLRTKEQGVVEVDPYPFGSERVDLSIEALVIPDREYASQAELRTAVEAARSEQITCRMVPASGPLSATDPRDRPPSVRAPGGDPQ